MSADKKLMSTPSKFAEAVSDLLKVKPPKCSLRSQIET